MAKFNISKKILSAAFSEQQVAAYFLIAFIAYVIVYGIFISHGFHTGLHSSYLFILIPVFLIDALKTLIESLSGGKFLRGKENISKVSVIIPTHNGGKLIGRVIRELLWRFKPGQIFVSSNGSTDNTVEIVKKTGVNLINNYRPIGKVPAINAALRYIRTPYVLIMDDDTFIGRKPLPTSLLDKGYEALAFRVLPQTGNWLTRLQFYEYRKSMDINKRAQNRTGSVQNISGAIGLFSTKELRRQIRIHSYEFSGEDLQRTLLVHLNRSDKGVAVVNSTIKTDVPKTVFYLFRQRVFGWYPGFYANTIKFSRLLISKRTPFLLRYDVFYNLILVMGLDALRLITFPAFIFYPWYIPLYFIVYVLIESITYVRLKPHIPYWVVLVYPFYGFFNLLARLTAAAVFIYRRLTVILSRYKRWDDYHKAPLIQRSFSSLTVNAAATAILFVSVSSAHPQVYDYFKVNNQDNNTMTMVATVTESPVTITAQKGDNLWKMSAKALDEYVAGKHIDTGKYNRNLTIYHLTALKNFRKVWVNDQINFSPEEIRSSLNLSGKI